MACHRFLHRTWLTCLLCVQLMAMEVLWTPQDESDSYTRDELFMDYPELNTL